MAFQLTPVDSPVRRMTILKYSQHARADQYKGEVRDVPVELLVNLTKALASVVENSYKQELELPKSELPKKLEVDDLCETYHEHKSTDAKCSITVMAASFAAYKGSQRLVAHNVHLLNTAAEAGGDLKYYTLSMNK
jgi:hypothetical protein